MIDVVNHSSYYLWQQRTAHCQLATADFRKKKSPIYRRPGIGT
jgi:hypothetical protein